MSACVPFLLHQQAYISISFVCLAHGAKENKLKKELITECPYDCGRPCDCAQIINDYCQVDNRGEYVFETHDVDSLTYIYEVIARNRVCEVCPKCAQDTWEAVIGRHALGGERYHFVECALCSSVLNDPRDHGAHWVPDSMDGPGYWE